MDDQVLKIGQKYYNGSGEVREIVAMDASNEPYIFFDHLDWSYTVTGVYDEHDTYWGDIRYDLHRVAPMDAAITPYNVEKHL